MSNPETNRSVSQFTERIDSWMAEVGITTTPLLTRRRLLFLLAQSAAAAVLACSTPTKVNIPTPKSTEVPFDYFPRSPQQDYQSPFKQVDFRDEAAKGPQDLRGNLNPVYIEGLVESLKNASKVNNPNQKATAIWDNVVWLATSPNTGGTALRIDRGGYILTAAHLMTDENDKPLKTPIQAYEPKTGISRPIVSYSIPPSFRVGSADIALLYAPTGEPFQAINGVALDSNFPESETELWMSALLVEQNITRSSLYGQVDLDMKDRLASYEGFIKVRGMIPFGGSSGAPVYDSLGNLRGVEGGAINEDGVVNSRKDYTGAALTPVSALKGILEELKQGRIFKLPLE